MTDQLKPRYMDRDWLYAMYVTREYPTIVIAQIATCNPATIRLWLRKHSIPLRTLGETRRLEATLSRKVKTASDRLSLSVGEFALGFERLCRSLRLGIWSILLRHALAILPPAGSNDSLEGWSKARLWKDARPESAALAVDLMEEVFTRVVLLTNNALESVFSRRIHPAVQRWGTMEPPPANGFASPAPLVSGHDYLGAR